MPMEKEAITSTGRCVAQRQTAKGTQTGYGSTMVQDFLIPSHSIVASFGAPQYTGMKPWLEVEDAGNDLTVARVSSLTLSTRPLT